MGVCLPRGQEAAYSFGADPAQLGRFAWFKENANKKTHPVGQKQPNEWGLHDMHGNVSEWCNDIFDESYYGKAPPDNPKGPAEGKQYVLRGGSWTSSADANRSAYRMGEESGFSDACLARRDRLSVRPKAARPSRCQVTCEDETHGSPRLLKPASLVPSSPPRVDCATLTWATPYHPIHRSPSMLFHTWVFAVFFLIVYPVFLLVRKDNRLMNIWLMIASYTFYGWWNPVYLLLLFGPRRSTTRWSCSWSGAARSGGGCG